MQMKPPPPLLFRVLLVHVLAPLPELEGCKHHHTRDPEEEDRRDCLEHLPEDEDGCHPGHRDAPLREERDFRTISSCLDRRREFSKVSLSFS